MARLPPLLPAPRGDLPVPVAPPGELTCAAAAPAARGALRTGDPRGGLRRRVSRWVCERYLPPHNERGVLCDFST